MKNGFCGDGCLTCEVMAGVWLCCHGRLLTRVCCFFGSCFVIVVCFIVRGGGFGLVCIVDDVPTLFTVLMC